MGWNEPSNFSTWAEAQEKCKAYGSSSTLASVHTLNMENTLAGLFENLDAEVWLGLSENDRKFLLITCFYCKMNAAD